MPPKQNSTASHRMTPKKLVVSLTQAHVPDVPSTPAPVSLTPNPYSQGSPKQLATPQSFQPSTPPLNGRKKSFHVQIPVSTPQPQFLTPDYRQFSTPQPQSQLNSTIVVLQPSPNIDRSEYTKYSKLDEKLKKSKPSVPSASKNLKRKRISDEDGDGNDDRLITAGVDQRAKADNLLSGFLDLADSIFTAEDNVQIDSSGGIAETSEMCRFWVPGSNPPCLCTALQTKLERSIESVISVNRFKQVSIDDLMRIEKLCEHSLRRTAAEYIMPPTSPGESEIQHWLMRITAFDNGIKSAKTILRIMAGGREEKQVYSEDLLDRALLLIKNNIEGAFIPMIEMRSTGEQQTIFKAAFAQKKPLGGLLHEVTNVLSLFSQMFSSEEATESAINSALYMAASIVFVENASNEKDSLMGIQRVEMFRMAAMDILAKIFARYPDQRSNIIFEQILTNLEKLPVNRATARQFKLVEGGKNIQLVSALIMRLVQTSGTYQAKKKRHRLTADEVNGKLVDGNAVSKHGDSKERIRGEKITKLHQLCVPLMDDAQKTSASIVNYLVQKAMNTTKTGDQPYRHLLDIFTEDFLAVLDSPEWPAAELLLRNLARNMCSIIDGEKQPVTAKTMALDMLGVMGSGICDLVVHLRENHHIREGGGDSLIYQLTNKYLEIDSSGGSRTAALAELEEDLLDWEGPFRISLEHLFEARPHDSALQSACGYHLTVWSSRVCSFREKIGEDDEVVASELKRCATNLRRMVLHKEWDNDLDLGIFSPSQIRLAYTLTVLNMPFCNYFEHLFNRLLRCMDDNQAQSRSKALKSVTQLLGKDPTILNRTQVIPYIIKKAQDASPLVRDSAVDLLGKCIAIRPDIESMVCKTIIERSVDTGVVVRKRSMKILKEIYMHTKRENLKVMIAEALVLRIKDNDNSVAEQAKKIFEEIWIAPFRSLIGEGGETPVEISPQMKLVSNERVAVIVKVVQKDILLAALLDVIKSVS
jgi:cohesin loading factor subunit SCC2